MPKKKGNPPVPPPPAIARRGPMPWQQAGAQSRAKAASIRIQAALEEFVARFDRGDLDRVPTYADLLRVAKVDRKTLFGKAQQENLILVDRFLKRAHASLGKPAPNRLKRVSFYERISINAQEAEAVRIRKQAEIDALSRELREARKQIDDLLSHGQGRPDRASKMYRPTASRI